MSQTSLAGEAGAPQETAQLRGARVRRDVRRPAGGEIGRRSRRAGRLPAECREASIAVGLPAEDAALWRRKAGPGYLLSGGHQRRRFTALVERCQPVERSCAVDSSSWAKHSASAEPSPGSQRAQLWRASMLCVGPGQVWLRPQFSAWVPPRDATEAVRLWLDVDFSPIGPFDAVVHHGPRRATATLAPCDVRTGRALLRLMQDLHDRALAAPPRQELQAVQSLTCVDRVHKLSLKLLAAAPRVYVHDGDRRRCLQVLRTERDASGRWRILWDQPIPCGTGSWSAKVVGFNAVFELHFPATEGHVPGPISGLPVRIEQMRMRHARRAQPRTGLSARFTHPLWPELGDLSYPLADVGPTGLALRAAPDDAALAVGMTIPELWVEGPDGRVCRLSGRVTSAARQASEQARIWGLSITAADPRSRTLWRQAVHRAMSPSTDSGAHFGAELWELYDRSGYFSLPGKSTARFASLRRDFERGLQLARVRAPHLIRHIVHPSPRGVEASMSMARAYRSTWMAFQLASRAGRPAPGRRPGEPVRDVTLRAFEELQCDPGFRWLLAHFANVAGTRTHQVPEQLARYCDDPGESAITRFRLYEMHTAPGGFADAAVESAARDIAFGPATCEESAEMIAEWRRRHPGCLSDALDMSSGQLGLVDAQARWNSADLERGRELWVARRAGHAVAFLLLEAGEVGISLFQLLDSLRVLFVVREPAIEQAALAFAARWHRKRDKPRFVYYRDPMPEPAWPKAACTDLGPGFTWVVSRRLLPDCLETMSEMLSSHVQCARESSRER